MSAIAPYYDVVIIGGGPAGATLGARLARTTNLSVAIFERETFPRQHIGESLTSIVVPLLAECGALECVLASDCYVVKYGGYYLWDGGHPWVTFFEQGHMERDGYYRWAFHVNRAEFDQLLLDNARKSGCDVFEGVPVRDISCEANLVGVGLGKLGGTTCRIVTDCSGRDHRRSWGPRKRDFLSTYRNVAIWCHVEGGRPAQSLDGDWNVFRENDLAPIANFAFEHGWFWYIPVPMTVGDQRLRTHSLGVVTHPGVLKRSGNRYSDTNHLLETARSVPFLGELVRAARPIHPTPLIATNYSMISSCIADYDEKRIRVGDAAYFVDPLFSSGVSFAMIHAAAAALVIEKTFDESMSQNLKREAWSDYQEMLQQMARSFAIGIDQWYAAIAHDNPESVYWRDRSRHATLPSRRETFQALVNTGFSGDLLRVMTKGTKDLATLDGGGPLLNALGAIAEREPSPGALIRLKPGVVLKDSVTLLANAYRTNGDLPNALHHGPYWDDPLRNQHNVRRSFETLTPCRRFAFADGPAAVSVRVAEAVQEGDELHRYLSNGWQCYEEVSRKLSAAQLRLLTELFVADMIEVRERQNDRPPVVLQADRSIERALSASAAAEKRKR